MCIIDYSVTNGLAVDVIHRFDGQVMCVLEHLLRLTIFMWRRRRRLLAVDSAYTVHLHYTLEFFFFTAVEPGLV